MQARGWALRPRGSAARLPAHEHAFQRGDGRDRRFRSSSRICALSMLRAIRSTQKENGDVAQLMGRWADPANPMSYGYQEVISGFCYVSAAYLHWKITGDEAFMKEFYPSVKKALEYSFTQRPDLGPSQIIAMPPHRAARLERYRVVRRSFHVWLRNPPRRPAFGRGRNAEAVGAGHGRYRRGQQHLDVSDRRRQRGHAEVSVERRPLPRLQRYEDGQDSGRLLLAYNSTVSIGRISAACPGSSPRKMFAACSQLCARKFAI